MDRLTALKRYGEMITRIRAQAEEADERTEFLAALLSVMAASVNESASPQESKRLALYMLEELIDNGMSGAVQ